VSVVSCLGLLPGQHLLCRWLCLVLGSLQVHGIILCAAGLQVSVVSCLELSPGQRLLCRLEISVLLPNILVQCFSSFHSGASLENLVKHIKPFDCAPSPAIL
jgi:hypothetical protein